MSKLTKEQLDGAEKAFRGLAGMDDLQQRLIAALDGMPKP